MFDYNKKLTLAQKLGLVPAPNKPLTNEVLIILIRNGKKLKRCL